MYEILLFHIGDANKVLTKIFTDCGNNDDYK